MQRKEKKLNRYINREVSWLKFNLRVLAEASNLKNPILERLKFLSIAANNLDEFFMVRVAGLKRRLATGVAVKTASGYEPKEILKNVLSTVRELTADHATYFKEIVKPLLFDEGIELVQWKDLTEDEIEYLNQIFVDRVFPVLTPLSVDPSHPFPYISGLSLNLAILVNNPESNEEIFARVKVPPLLPRFIETAEHGSSRFLPLESLIAEHLSELFPGMNILAHHTFRVTRNQDLELEEDETENLDRKSVV
mgnify:CR=1 FL=1